MEKRLTAICLLAALTVGLAAYAVDSSEPGLQADDEELLDEYVMTEDETEDVLDDYGDELILAANELDDTAGTEDAETKENTQKEASEQKSVNVVDSSLVGATITERAITLRGIETTLRNNNKTIKMNAETLKSLEELDVEEALMFLPNASALYEARSAAEQMLYTVQSTTFLEDEAANEVLINSLIMSINSTISQIDSTLATISSSEDSVDDAVQDLDVQIMAARRGYEYQADMLVYSAETMYISIATLKLSVIDVERGINTLDRSIAEMEKRYELGQISQLSLEQVKQQRTSVYNQLQTLNYNIEELELTLGSLLGWDVGTKAEVQEIASVTASQLNQINYQKDLTTALENCYNIWVAEEDIRIISNDLTTTAGQKSLEAAKISKTIAERNMTQGFMSKFNAISEKKRLVTVAQQDYEFQQKLYDATKKQYNLGVISKNTLLSAEDELESTQAAVNAAQYDLILAYNDYTWAKRGVVSS